mgnify:CR=1 FL=1
MRQEQSTAAGFTLIEIIISLAVFSVVITMAVGALLILIGTSDLLRGEQSVMTNLTFAVDSMTREIRTGTDYFCDSRPNTSTSHPGGIDNMFADTTDLNVALAGEILDCPDGKVDGDAFHGIAFREGGDSITGTSDTHILYYFNEDDGRIYRRVGAGDAQSIVSSGIFIEEADFVVTGTEPLTGSGGGTLDQPTVTIYIEARESDDPSGKPFYMQTTITQRQLDV